MVVKTYRGLLADGGQEKIPLSTKDGSVGYRVIRFDLFSHRPGGTSHVESVMQIFKTEQTSIPTANSIVNFADNDLIAAAYLTDDVNNTSGPLQIVIFDKEIFNQDIFVTHTDEGGSAKCNYYIELEQMKLDHTQNMNATLKAIRGAAVD